ncbi:uncharacterized protein G2W53_004278 [Senna tora]|uniref:Uncharacterized protein n=1 Tax=Senna tora TaxID=362788 RepID=A0A835CJ72_9FABA|nr:uncharacterized protein G2W53_004278 [Senna tora]
MLNMALVKFGNTRIADELSPCIIIRCIITSIKLLEIFIGSLFDSFLILYPLTSLNLNAINSCLITLIINHSVEVLGIPVAFEKPELFCSLNPLDFLTIDVSFLNLGTQVTKVLFVPKGEISQFPSFEGVGATLLQSGSVRLPPKNQGNAGANLYWQNSCPNVPTPGPVLDGLRLSYTFAGFTFSRLALVPLSSSISSIRISFLFFGFGAFRVKTLILVCRVFTLTSCDFQLLSCLLGGRKVKVPPVMLSIIPPSRGTLRLALAALDSPISKVLSLGKFDPYLLNFVLHSSLSLAMLAPEVIQLGLFVGTGTQAKYLTLEQGEDKCFPALQYPLFPLELDDPYFYESPLEPKDQNRNIPGQHDVAYTDNHSCKLGQSWSHMHCHSDLGPISFEHPKTCQPVLYFYTIMREVSYASASSAKPEYTFIFALDPEVITCIRNVGAQSISRASPISEPIFSAMSGVWYSNGRFQSCTHTATSVTRSQSGIFPRSFCLIGQTLASGKVQGQRQAEALVEGSFGKLESLAFPPYPHLHLRKENFTTKKACGSYGEHKDRYFSLESLIGQLLSLQMEWEGGRKMKLLYEAGMHKRWPLIG